MKIPLTNIIPLSEARSNFSKIIENALADDVFLVTRGGKPAVVIANVDKVNKIGRDGGIVETHTAHSAEDRTTKTENQPAPKTEENTEKSEQTLETETIPESLTETIEKETAKSTKSEDESDSGFPGIIDLSGLAEEKNTSSEESSEEENNNKETKQDQSTVALDENQEQTTDKSIETENLELPEVKNPLEILDIEDENEAQAKTESEIGEPKIKIQPAHETKEAYNMEHEMIKKSPKKDSRAQNAGADQSQEKAQGNRNTENDENSPAESPEVSEKRAESSHRLIHPEQSAAFEDENLYEDDEGIEHETKKGDDEYYDTLDPKDDEDPADGHAFADPPGDDSSGDDPLRGKNEDKAKGQKIYSHDGNEFVKPDSNAKDVKVNGADED